MKLRRDLENYPLCVATGWIKLGLRHIKTIIYHKFECLKYYKWTLSIDCIYILLTTFLTLQMCIVWVHMCMVYMHMCVEARAQHQILSSIILHTLLWGRISPEPEACVLWVVSTQKTPEILQSLSCWALRLQTCMGPWTPVTWALECKCKLLISVFN